MTYSIDELDGYGDVLRNINRPEAIDVWSAIRLGMGEDVVEHLKVLGTYVQPTDDLMFFCMPATYFFAPPRSTEIRTFRVSEYKVETR